MAGRRILTHSTRDALFGLLLDPHCLAGLAPISRQSGNWQGKERIQGGQAHFRRKMYMPALCTIRHNLSCKKKYNQLIKAGKPAKVALTAIMRKLVVMANALLRDGRKWSQVRA